MGQKLQGHVHPVCASCTTVSVADFGRRQGLQQSGGGDVASQGIVLDMVEAKSTIVVRSVQAKLFWLC